MTANELKVFISNTLRINAIGEDSEMGKTRGWDSIRQVQLMLALEERFEIEIPADIFGELTSFSTIADFLRDETVLIDD